MGRLHEDGPPLVWLDAMDRGEAWLWYRVEFETAPGTYTGGWIYGQFLEPYRDGRTYADYFLDVTEHKFWTKTNSLKKRLGKPVKSDGWIEEWPGLTLSYSSFHDGETEERYLSAVKISDVRRDFGGIWVGDGAESLRELVDGLLADRWKGERELKEGDKWDIEHMFPDESAIETHISEIEDGAERFTLFRGRLSSSASNLLEAFRARNTAALLARRHNPDFSAFWATRTAR